jgi:phosphoenolpyruvate synthase/pyruvate phosphate dikinase
MPMIAAGTVRRIRHADGLGRQGAPLKVRTNADTPPMRAGAMKFGAEGIGLCRTEHMFFEETASSRCAR